MCLLCLKSPEVLHPPDSLPPHVPEPEVGPDPLAGLEQNQEPANPSDPSFSNDLNPDNNSSRPGGGLSILATPAPVHQPFFLRAFKLNELKTATRDFNEEWLLGEGGYGKVYRGELEDPKTGNDVLCAVKRLSPYNIRAQPEWLAEIQILSRISHPNLVQLYGYCTEGEEGLLINEYVPLGNLKYHLYGPFENGHRHLTWEERLRIAYQCAVSLSFLHEKGVIHRDFKPTNVLLDSNRQVKLTDFGLAKVVGTEPTHVPTRIMRTEGYLDPNYVETEYCSRASDVFAYGILLLVLLTGRPAKEQDGPNSVSLSVWARNFFIKTKEVVDFVDPLIIDEMDSKPSQKLANKLATMAKFCVEESPQSRPAMKDIVELLKVSIRRYETYLKSKIQSTISG